LSDIHTYATGAIAEKLAGSLLYRMVAAAPPALGQYLLVIEDNASAEDRHATFKITESLRTDNCVRVVTRQIGAGRGIEPCYTQRQNRVMRSQSVQDAAVSRKESTVDLRDSRTLYRCEGRFVRRGVSC
jgi:hypothetical protein